jgi:hypothetical protein
MITPPTIGQDPWGVDLNNGLLDLQSQITSLSTSFNASQFVVTDPQFGAVGDGVTDDSAAIQAALDAANAAGGGQVYIPAGDFLCSTLPLRIYDNTRLTLNRGATMLKGTAATFLINGTAGQALGVYTGHSHIVVEGGTWNNRATTVTGYSLCLAFGHATDITVQNTTILNVSGYHAIEFNAISKGRAYNCQFLGMKHTGDRAFTEAVQIDLMKSSAEFGGFGPYDDTPCTDIEVSGCTFGASGTATTQAWPRAVGSHTAVLTNWHTNIRVVNNTIADLTSYAVKAYNWNQAVINSNSISGCGAGIWARSAETTDAGGTQDMRSLTISGNTVYNTTGLVDDGILVQGESGGVVREVAITGNVVDIVGDAENGIRTEYVQHYAIAGNTVAEIDGAGISQENTDRGTVVGNTVYNATGGSGISAVTCTGLMIASNNLRNIGNNGILIQGGSDTSISSNYVKSPGQSANATYYGIRLSTSADHIRITDNKVRPNGSGNEAINGLAITNTCTNILRYGNDLYGATWTTGALVDASTTPRTSPYDTTTLGALSGTATLIGGTIVVNTAAVTAASNIQLTAQTSGAAPGALRVSARVAGTSFTITSTSGTDTSLVGWMIADS